MSIWGDEDGVLILCTESAVTGYHCPAIFPHFALDLSFIQLGLNGEGLPHHHFISAVVAVVLHHGRRVKVFSNPMPHKLLDTAIAMLISNSVNDLQAAMQKHFSGTLGVREHQVGRLWVDLSSTDQS